jgi:protein-disulfide isomerase
MLNGLRPLRNVVLAASLAAIGCHAQPPASADGGPQPVEPGVKLSPAMARRIELIVRSKADVSADFNIQVGTPRKSTLNGYDQIDIFFNKDGEAPKSAAFLISSDGRTLAQLNKFDLTQDLTAGLSTTGRPSRGGPDTAPVTIVGFDDLECPFCAQMNDELLPAVLNHYKNQVRLVYRDFPLDELHPWARHAANDANCLAANSASAYWNFVDYVHVHSADMAGTEKTADKAAQNLDKLALDDGTKQHLNQSELIACILKQDATIVNRSILSGEAEPLHLSPQAPILFINGEKIEGIVPIETLYRVIDRALIAAGQTPPPAAPPAKTAPTPAKPGS